LYIGHEFCRKSVGENKLRVLWAAGEKFVSLQQWCKNVASTPQNHSFVPAEIAVQKTSKSRRLLADSRPFLEPQPLHRMPRRKL
jgi:hypothetical protein